ncbi:hypothetical protein EJB05_48800, partial [Eragrostis curvula]
RPGSHRSGVRSECDGSPAWCRAGDTEAQQRGQSGVEAWPRGLACREGCIAGEDEVLLALGRINDHDEIRCKCDDRGWHGSIFLRDKIHDDPQCRYL